MTARNPPSIRDFQPTTAGHGVLFVAFSLTSEKIKDDTDLTSNLDLYIDWGARANSKIKIWSQGWG